MKLANRCIFIKINDIDLLGCPETSVVYGLTEEGFSFAKKAQLTGINEDDIQNLTSDLQELYTDMVGEHFFENDYKKDDGILAYIHITQRCNLRCIGCYSEKDGRGHNDMSLDKWKTIIDNLKRANIKTIIISGGEPFLREDIEEIIAYMHANDMYVVCITNGTQNIDRYLKSNCDRLSISVEYAADSSRIRQTDYVQLGEKAKALKKAGKDVKLIFNLHAHNLDAYNEMESFANSLGIERSYSLFTAEPNYKTSSFLLQKDDQSLEKLKHLVLKNGNIDDMPKLSNIGCKLSCGAGKNMLAISNTGDIYPCHMFLGSPFILGNAITDEVKAILEDAHFQDLATVSKKPGCKACKYAYLCGGGCTYRAFTISKDLYNTDPLCDVYKSVFNEVFKSI